MKKINAPGDYYQSPELRLSHLEFGGFIYTSVETGRHSIKESHLASES